MIVAAQLVAKVAAEGASETERQIESVGRKAEETRGHFEGLKNALSMAAGFAIFGGVSAGFGFLKDQFTDVIKAAMDQQQIQAQLASRLKDTSSAAHISADAINEYAEKLSQLTPFSKDTILQGDNMLLTFKSIGKDVFPQVTHSMVELSQVMGGDMQGAAIMLGKAMDDPVQGITALHRVGVSFDDKTKELIKTYMAHGEAAKAQTLILQNLAGQGFSTAAEAAGKTFGGQLEILTHRFDDIKEKIGGALLPVLNDMLNKYIVPLATKFSDWMLKGGGLQDFQVWLKHAVSIFENQFLPDLNKLLNTYIIPLATAFYNVASQLVNFVGWLQKGGPAADTVKVALAGIVTVIAGFKVAGFLNDLNKGIGDAITNAGKMKQAFSDFVTWFGNTFAPGLQTGKTAIQDVGTASEVSSGEVTMLGTASETTAAEVTTLGTDSTIAAGEQGVSGLSRAVSGFFNLVGPALGIGLLTEQLSIAIPIFTGKADPTGGGHIHGYHGPHGYASGGMNIPSGNYLVGERGPEIMQVPAGSNIIPNNMIGAYNGAGGSPVVVQFNINGYQFARAVMPDFVTAMRGGTGRLGI